MQHARRFLLAVALVVGAVCLTSAPALAGVASMSVGGAGIHWTPSVAYESAVLTVSGGDGVQLRYEFDAGVTPSLSLFDKDGYPLPDGSYTWELRLAPQMDAATLGQLEAAREAGAELRMEPIQASGYFTIRGGAFVNPNAEEMGLAHAAGAAQGALGGNEPSLNTRDQIINDDLIVTQSICVGTDCNNGESFGFDTIRLKENNLRIKFLDTSVGSFPSNDWELTANDSANGGANRFSITDISGGRTPFTVEAGAPSNSLYVDDGGRVGFGTSTPVVELHVKDGDTPTLRLEQDGSSGFTPQVWDVAGNETNWFVRDATHGSLIPFKIRPSAPANSLYINTDGAVGFGTASPKDTGGGDVGIHLFRTNGSAQLFVEENSSTEQTRNLIDMENNGPVQMRFMDDSANGDTWQMSNFDGGFNIVLQGSGTQQLQIGDNGDITVSGTVVHSSSRATKSNFSALDPQAVLERVSSLPITSWNYKRSPSILHVGPMAEDFYEAFGLGQDAQHIALSDSAGVALAAIQGLNQQLQAKDQKISDLEQRLAALEAALSAAGGVQ